ncbi:MAG: hypothetical protein EP330_27660 [Deltaproteobacteria bacterium]|nr:MAG: hypothetical protein EP330_27660 [Deltaproteobacteria bacterium]
MRYLALLVCVACAQAAEEPVLIADPVAAAELLATDLDEATRLAGTGERQQAEAAWGRAHDRYEDELEPWLRAHRGDELPLRLEYGLGRIHDEMGKRRGRPRDKAAVWVEKLREAVKPAAVASSGV